MSTTFEVANFREQGVNVCVVVVSSQFGNRPSSEQQDFCDAMQMSANSAGLPGTVVPVWDSGDGRMGFYAPRPWHSFFRSIGLRDVARNISHKMTRD